MNEARLREPTYVVSSKARAESTPSRLLLVEHLRRGGISIIYEYRKENLALARMNVAMHASVPAS